MKCWVALYSLFKDIFTMRAICTKQNHLTVKMSASRAYINASIFYQGTNSGSSHTHTHPVMSKHYSLTPIITRQAHRWGHKPVYDSTGAMRNLLCPETLNELSQLCRSPLFSMKRSHLHNYSAQMGLMTPKPLGHRLLLCVYKVLKIMNLDRACSYSCHK